MAPFLFYYFTPLLLPHKYTTPFARLHTCASWGGSLDYLVGKDDVELDKDISNKILTIQKLPEPDKSHILFTIDAMIRDAKARTAYSL